ncbi:MAG: hypothetical protein R3A12_09885 [Ignavibacteria bacterium]
MMQRHSTFNIGTAGNENSLIQEYKTSFILMTKDRSSDPAVFPNYDTLIGVSALTASNNGLLDRKS